MLPSTLVSTYQQYKQDTDSIAAWLASTAKSLDFSSELSPATTANASGSETASTGRLKGKARVQAKKQAASSAAATSSQPLLPAKPKYTINIKDFIPLAEYVAAKTFPVPNTFATTIDRVISVRSAFGSKLGEHGKPLNEASYAKHQHFVEGKHHLQLVLHPCSVKFASVVDTYAFLLFKC